jgi:hypothetical protein
VLRGEMLPEWSIDASGRSQSASEDLARSTSLALAAYQTTATSISPKNQQALCVASCMIAIGISWTPGVVGLSLL